MGPTLGAARLAASPSMEPPPFETFSRNGGLYAVATRTWRCVARRFAGRGDPRECAAELGAGGFPMPDLDQKKRDSLPDSTFGLPDERKYPMPDKAHARNPKARASKQQNKGRISAAEEKKIDRKADRILDK